MVLIGNTDDFLSESGQPVRRFKTKMLLWPSEHNFKSNSTACVSAGGYSFSPKGTSCGRTRKQKYIRVKLKSRLSDGTESLLIILSEFLERLVALIPAPKFHTTRYYGVLASCSPHRRYLPDEPTPLVDVDQKDPRSVGLFYFLSHQSARVNSSASLRESINEECNARKKDERNSQSMSKVVLH